MAVRDGIRRPGAIERHLHGISAKVLAERLRKLVEYRLLSKTTFPEAPPRTEYSLTRSGEDLMRIIEQLRSLDLAHEQSDEGDDAELNSNDNQSYRRLRTVSQKKT